MKTLGKLLLAVIAVPACLFALILVETLPRQLGRQPLVIHGLPLDGVQVSGSSVPDFLWAGRAWNLQVVTKQPLHVEIGTWQADLPPGEHGLFCNHDGTNLLNYSQDRSPLWPFEVRMTAKH